MVLAYGSIVTHMYVSEYVDKGSRVAIAMYVRVLYLYCATGTEVQQLFRGMGEPKTEREGGTHEELTKSTPMVLI